MIRTVLVEPGCQDLHKLVEAARRMDPDAWTSIVNRFTPLVRSIERRYRIPEADLGDVTQTVWLTRTTHIDRLREPKALPGWIATVARRACLDVLRNRRFTLTIDSSQVSDTLIDGIVEDAVERLLRQECHDAVHAALAELPRRHQQLLKS